MPRKNKTVARKVVRATVPEHIKPLLNSVKRLFDEPKLDHTNILKFLEVAMEVVELERELSGRQKKDLVIALVKYGAHEMIPDEQEFKLVEHFVDYFIDQTIDEMIEVNNGKLKINPKKSRFYKCFQGCFSSCKSKDRPTQQTEAVVETVRRPKL